MKKESTPYLGIRDGFVNSRNSVIYRFQAEPGQVTFVNCSPIRGSGYRMVAGLLEIVDSPILDHIAGPHYQVAAHMPVGDFLEQYAGAGGGHHLYIARGNILNRLSSFCKALGFDYRVVDG